MAKASVTRSPSRSLANVSMGPKFVGLGVGLFVVTRIIKWLPLGIVGSWINGVLWPILLLSIVGGAGLMYMKSKRP